MSNINTNFPARPDTRPAGSDRISEVPLSRPIQRPQPAAAPVSRRQPAPIRFPREKLNPFAALEAFSDGLDVLKNLNADQVSFELAQIYMFVEQMPEASTSLEMRQGLKALEDQIRLLEILHTGQTALVRD